MGSVLAYGGLLDLGISGAVVKYVAEYQARRQHEETRSLIATALRLYALLGLMIMLLSLGLAPLFSNLFNIPPDQQQTARQLVILMGLALGFSIPSATTNAVLRGLQRFDLINVITIGGTLLTAGATVVVLLRGGGLVGMVAVSIPISLLMQIPTVIFIRRTAPDVQVGWRGASRHRVRAVLSYSSSIFVVQAAGQLQSKTDEIVIGAFLPVIAVTPYGIARRLSEVAQLLTRQFLKVLLPLASELNAQDEQDALRSMYVIATRLALASFLPVGGSIVILARPLLSAWVGPESPLGVSRAAPDHGRHD